MIYDIGEILKNCLAAEALPYVETLAGVVQIETVKKATSKSTMEAKSYPVYCPQKGACDPQNIEALIPDKKRKSLFYFERNGDVLFTGRERGYSNFTTNIVLVGWLNPKKLGSSDCSITAPIISQILRVFDKKHFNDVGGVYSKIYIKPLSVKTKEPVIFQKYKLGDKFYHLLEYPYDYFSINLQVTFSLHDNCIDNFIVNPEIKC